ncbi:hypothetical protein GGU11DRAFT_651991, partial [Lentinula aff. detonsa]
VLAIYSKTAGKGVFHAYTENLDNVCMASYMALQLFEFYFGREFKPQRSQPSSTFQANRFCHIPPSAFLCMLN